MQIAITGASGQLGRAVIEQLVKEETEHTIIGIARTPEKAQDLSVEIRHGDYTKPDLLKTAFQDVDVLLLVSGLDTPENRIIQHRNAIEAAKKSGVRKIVYTSIVGNPEKTTFGPIVASNRQTEEDVKASGLKWVIGRNGLYLDADLEYLDQYRAIAKIENSAGLGQCAYTSRKELAIAYSRILQYDKFNGNTFNLTGEAVTQDLLAHTINEVYGWDLSFENIAVDRFEKLRTEALGDYYGPIIGGIYESIKNGDFHPASDFDKITGRAHKSVRQLIMEHKMKHHW
jgi:NAD(P)H dehydrogenase (quinone)